MKKIMSSLLLCLIFNSFNLSAQGFNSEVIEQKSHYVVKDGKLKENTSTLIQINARQGDKDAHVAIFYVKGEKLKIRTAQIEDVNGNVIRKLQNKDITDQNASSNSTMYSDHFVKHFELIHNSYPYRVRYEYEHEKSKFLYIESLNCAYKNPLRKGIVVVETPIGYSLQYKQKYMEEPSVVKGEKTTLYTWNFSYNTEHKFDINTNYNVIEAPQLTVTPDKIKYGVEGRLNDWTGLGKWIFSLNKGRDILPLSEKQAIDKLLTGIENDYEKIKVLYNYLQDRTRYVNIMLKVGGLQTYPAEYVCSNRYGDCKALTNYMQAMLKYVGIKSHYTLINSDTFIIDIDRDFPSQVFNHVILTVPMKQDTLYLECTGKNIAFSYIPTAIQGRLALLVDEDDSHLIEVPAMQEEDVINFREIAVEPSNGMGSFVKMKTTLRGYSYELYTYIKENLSKNNVEQFISNNIMSGVYTLVEYEFEEIDRNSPHIVLNAGLTMNNVSKKYGNNLSLSPFTWSLPNYETPENRKYDLQINTPMHKVDKITYTLLKNSFEKTPNDISIESRFGTYQKTHRKEGSNLVIDKKLIINAGRYTLAEYADFYEFIRQVKNGELTNIFLEIL